MSEGKRLWETSLAAPPAGEPIVDDGAGTITLGTAAGAIFRIDAAALRDRTPVNRPLAAVGPGKLQHGLCCLMDLGDGRLAMAGAEGTGQILFYDPKAAEEPITAVTLPGPLSCRPIVFRGGVLAPCTLGQVFLLGPPDGGPKVEPFQPTLQPGAELSWRRPALVGDDELLITDGRTRLYRIGVKDKPKPFLAELASVELAEPIVTPVAALGESAVAVDRTGMLVAFALPDLKQSDVAALDARCVWGPETVGEQILLATDRNELLFVGADGKLLGRAPLPYGPLAGRPLAADGAYFLASAGGVVWQVKSPVGDSPAEEVANVDLGRPLASGPVFLEGKLLVARPRRRTVRSGEAGSEAAGEGSALIGWKKEIRNTKSEARNKSKARILK